MSVTSYILRFKANILSKLIKKPSIFPSAELTTTELEESKKLWLLYDQNVIISKENFSKVKNSLNLFYDENNFFRFKTRISSVETVSCDKKCPILSNKDSYVTNALESVCHSGLTSVLNFTRSKFWMVKGRQTVKKILKKCFIYKYVNHITFLGLATPCLPDFKIKCNRNFKFVGVHFAGPIYYKVKKSIYKVYVLLFTCGVTRASTIELTIDQSLHSVMLAPLS